MIPEGKQQIFIEAMYKEPIEGIPFSNTGITVAVSKYIPEGEDALHTELDKLVTKLGEEYSAKLKKEMKKMRDAILSQRGEELDAIRVELDKKYKGYIEELRAEIIKLKKQIKDAV